MIRRDKFVCVCVWGVGGVLTIRQSYNMSVPDIERDKGIWSRRERQRNEHTHTHTHTDAWAKEGADDHDLDKVDRHGSGHALPHLHHDCDYAHACLADPRESANGHVRGMAYLHEYGHDCDPRHPLLPHPHPQERWIAYSKEMPFFFVSKSF